MAKGGGGEKVQEQTSTTTPWDQQSPFLKDIFQLGAKAYNLTPKAAFTGDMVARPDSNQLQGLDWAQNLAASSRNLGGGTSSLGDQMFRGLQSSAIKPWSTFADYDPTSLKPVVEAATRPIFEQYSRDLIPQMQSKSMMEGAYGGNRAESLNPQRVMEDFGRTTSDVASGLAFQDFQTLRGQMPGLYGMVPQMAEAGYDLGLKPAQTLGQVGADRQGFQQDLINEALGRYQMQQTVPWIGLPEYAGIINGAPNFASSQSTVKAPGQSSGGNFIKSAIGGGLAGGQLGFGLGAAGTATGTAALGALGPWALGGAALGGLMGFL